MNGLVLLLPFLCVRFALPALINRDSLRRAARFAPMHGRERWAYWAYQALTAAILLYLPALRVTAVQTWTFAVGLLVYTAGIALCAAACLSFARCDGLCTSGAYGLSRNPMYVAYPLCFAGMALMTCSMALMALTFAFQASARWIVRAEERECARRFGDEYARYAAKVRRWL